MMKKSGGVDIGKQELLAAAIQSTETDSTRKLEYWHQMQLFPEKLVARRGCNASVSAALERIGCLTRYLKGRLQMDGLRHG